MDLLMKIVIGHGWDACIPEKLCDVLPGWGTAHYRCHVLLLQRDEVSAIFLPSFS